MYRFSQQGLIDPIISNLSTRRSPRNLTPTTSN